MKDLETINVEFSDGLVLTLSQSNWRLSRRKDKLERQAVEAPMDDPDDQLFAANFYPLLAAAVISGNCPTVEECLEKVPEDDLEKWYQAAKEINPGWFVYMNAISELLKEQEETTDMDTKKELVLNLTSDVKTPDE